MKKFISEYLELVRDWHSTKNGELKPDEVTYGSHKKVWWLCPKGHDYDSIISNRTGASPSACPQCRRNSSQNL